MGLVVNPSKTKYKSSVEVLQPGETTPERFTATFTSVTADEFKKLMSTGMKDSQVVDQVLLGWEGIRDAEGGALNFDNEEHRKLVRQLSVFDAAVARQFVADNTTGEGRRKN